MTSEDAKGGEVILVVEDDTAVRDHVCRLLRKLGYFVLEAKNGEDAITVLQEYHAPVHLVITDLVMPEMSGSELIAMLHAWNPHLRVLFISGYSEDVLESKGALDTGARYLSKPFDVQTLTRTVRELLSAPTERST